MAAVALDEQSEAALVSWRERLGAAAGELPLWSVPGREPQVVTAHNSVWFRYEELVSLVGAMPACLELPDGSLLVYSSVQPLGPFGTLPTLNMWPRHHFAAWYGVDGKRHREPPVALEQFRGYAGVIPCVSSSRGANGS